MKPDLKTFDEKLSRVNVRGEWFYDNIANRAIGGPHPGGEAHIWKWQTMYPLLIEACEALPESTTARRSLLFESPDIAGHGTTQTLLAGLQMIKPGETAWAHRHSMAALRFVVKGNPGAYTAVEGEICPMEDYDLILTPQWTWHDHHNRDGENTIWLDALDVPLIYALNVLFYETHPGKVRPLKEKKSEYLQARTGLVRPTWERAKRDGFAMRYRWKDIKAQLDILANGQGNPYEGVSLEYVNPITGGPAMPTVGCWIQMLRSGEKTKKHRHTSSSVYFVVAGEGTTIVEGKSLDWAEHDCFVVPNWAWHEHINRSGSESATLFSVNDIPVFNAFGLYREEPTNSLGAIEPSQIRGQ